MYVDKERGQRSATRAKQLLRVLTTIQRSCAGKWGCFVIIEIICGKTGLFCEVLRAHNSCYKHSPQIACIHIPVFF